MARKVRMIPSPGRTIESIPSSGCNWCLYGTRPDDRGICQTCVRSFKRLLSSTPWSKLRKSLLSEHPYCTLCQSHGVIELAEEIDHIREWRLFPDLFWDTSNLRPLSKTCHSTLTQIQRQ